MRARVRPYGSPQPEALARRAGNLTTAGWIAAVLDGTAPLAVAPEAAYVARCHAKAVECAKVRGTSIVQRATARGCVYDTTVSFRVVTPSSVYRSALRV